MIFGKWYFIILSAIAIVGNFLNQAGSVASIGSIIAIIICFMAVAIIERLDKLIKINEEKTV